MSPLVVASGPATRVHVFEVVWRPNMDAGIEFVVLCPWCRARFGGLAWSESRKGEVQLHEVVNGLHAKVEKVRAAFAGVECPGLIK